MGKRPGIEKWIAIAVLLLTTGCGNKITIQERERKQAPVGRYDVGVLTEGATEEQIISILRSHPKAQVRILSKAHGLYEIFGVDQSKVELQITVQV